jgi:hypothetical protein
MITVLAKVDNPTIIMSTRATSLVNRMGVKMGLADQKHNSKKPSNYRITIICHRLHSNSSRIGRRGREI